MDTGLIIIEEFIKNSRIEPSFIILLHKEGLIDIIANEGKQYIRESQLSDLERYARWHYELSVNIEGIDVIQNLLEKMNDMERELHELRRVLHYHRSIWDNFEE
ncbi:MAG: chaperone modulator CbpM [Dysgonomonas sp.]|nr:chaperone modulator CbpM [Dysgonomonas sp.]